MAQSFKTTMPWKSKTVENVCKGIRIDRTVDRDYNHDRMEYYGRQYVWYEVVWDDTIVDQFKTIREARSYAKKLQNDKRYKEWLEEVC